MFVVDLAQVNNNADICRSTPPDDGEGTQVKGKNDRGMTVCVCVCVCVYVCVCE